MSRINADTEYQDILDKIELGLEAFENLLAFIKGMSKAIENYDVFEDVDNSYKETKEGHNIVKDFIKVGLEFVSGHPDADQSEFDMRKVNSLAGTTNSIISGDLETLEEHQAPAVHLSQADKESLDTFQQSTPVNKIDIIETDKKVTKPVNVRKKKKRCNKDKRQKRLLEFQEKLVKSQGLPPSRLMARKNLESEFEQIAGVEAEPASFSSGHNSVLSPLRGPSPSQSVPVLPVLTPGQPDVQPFHQPPAVPWAGHNAPPAPVPPDGSKVPMPGSQIVGQMAGISSGYNQNFTLSSSPQSFSSNTSLPVGWSEARPIMGYRWDGMPLLPSGLPIWSNSGNYYLLALSTSP